MARIRTVKPEFFRHEGLFESEIESGLPIRVAFAGLFTCADRDGRFMWRPRRLKLDCLPFDDVDFSDVLDRLLADGFIDQYGPENEYGCIPSWHNHQVINSREAKTTIPSPDCEPQHDIAVADTGQPESNQELTTAHTTIPSVHSTKHVHAQGEGKGREGKGRERKGKERKIASPTRRVFAYWQKVMNKPNSKLTKDRQAKIEARFQDSYTVDDMERAIDGCARSAHHMGQNDRNTVYDDLELICRDGKHLESFRDNIGDGKSNQKIQGVIDWYHETEDEDHG